MIELPSSDTIQYWSGVATIFGLPIAILAFVYAARQLYLAQKAGSGASLIALSEAFRQNWSAFVAAVNDGQKRHAFADLANALEIACAVFRDGIFFGHSEDLLKHYLVHQFRAIQESDLARQWLVSLLQTKETFNEIRWFVEKHRSLINSTALGEMA